ncbi:zinc finger, CCHC-type containing protein [Tanacetum coccineum]
MAASMSVVYVLTTPIPEDGGDDPTVEQVRKRNKRDNDDYVCRSLILKGMSDSLFDIYQNVESSKELRDSLEAKYMAKDASSKKFLVSNFTNYKMTDSRLVMKQYNELLGILGRFTQHKMNMDKAIQVSCIIDKLPPSWKDFKHTLKHKEELTLVELGIHLRIEESLRAKNLVSSSVLNNYGYKQVIESNKFVLSKHGVFIGFGYLSNRMFMLNIVNNDIASTFMSTSKLNDSILWHARLGHVHFKRMHDMSKDGLILAFDIDTEKCKTCMLTKITKKPFQNVKRETEVLELIHGGDLHVTPSLGNKKYFVTFIDDASRFCYVYLLHTKDDALDKFKVFKTEVELQQGSQIKRFRTDRGGGYMDTLYFQSVCIIHETTAPYTPQQNGISERKNRVLKEMVNSMLPCSGPSERGIECIFVGYAEHFKAFRFLSVPRPSQRSLINGTKDIGCSVVLEEVTEEVVQQPEPELRKS